MSDDASGYSIAVFVNVDNFVRAETDRRLEALLLAGPGLNRWHHQREPVSLDDQTVTRVDRDTLSSTCVADISEGAILTVPEGAGRYLSVMIVNQDHYVNKVFREPGDYELTVGEFDTPYVLVVARAFVDPGSPADVAAVNEWQDGLELIAGSARPFASSEHDTASFHATRLALLELARGLDGFARACGSRERSTRFTISSAARRTGAECPRTRSSRSVSNRVYRWVSTR